MKVRIDGSSEISILSYLSGVKEGLPVGLSLTSGNPSAPDRSAPFTVLYDSDPLTRVVAASFVTDSGCELKKVFLLLQKDRYDLQRDELWPLTNRDIDEAWERRFSLRADAGDDSSPIILAGQTGDKGLPVPFSSLFLCKKRRLYFHPPCPLCGRPLRLCMDDDLLLSSALRPYSGSTKRYLHCVSCSTQRADALYVRDRGNDDPETLHDLHGLIDKFRLLREDNDPAGDFPCIRCPDHDFCYGESHGAHSRIVPFSFYPFHLLIFDSMSLPAADFLPLVSGGSIDALKSTLCAKGEQGRIDCLDGIRRDGVAGLSLFPPHDDRFFLEVLYLKLSFLGDVLRQIFPLPGIAAQPEMEWTIDRIWVSLPVQSGLLPSYWTFRTKFLDIVRPPDSSRLFPKPASSNLLQAGLIWFYALLANNRQDSREVMLSLKDKLSGSCNLPEIPSSLFSNEAFAPQQIFLDPGGREVNSQWLPLWEQSIRMGFTLIKSAIDPVQKWSAINFCTELENLRAVVRETMLGGAPLTMEATARVDQPAGDEIIHGILAGIIDKWRDRGTAETPPASPVQEGDITETLIFSPAGSAAPLSPGRDEEEWTETVVLSARGVKPESPPSLQRDTGNDAMLETVALAAGGVKREPPTEAGADEGEDAGLETVIMSAGGRPEGTSGAINGAGAGTTGEGKEEAVDGDAVPETVILNPRKDKIKAKGWKD
jgi:hypothetical protein